MSASNEWVWWLLGGFVGFGLLAYAAFEYIQWLERTQIYKLANGLRFVAHGFQLETNKTDKRILIKTTRGHYTKAQTEARAAAEQYGNLNISVAAMGLRVRVAPVLKNSSQTAATQCAIHFEGAEEKVTLSIPGVPIKVGEAFTDFWRQIAVWIDKLEAIRAKEEAAKAAADAENQAAAGDGEEADANSSLTVEEQVEQWRKMAGFKGTSSDIGLDEQGKIVWFIDLDATGRVILHSNKQTAFASLLGAQLVSLGNELEVTVRDEFWTEKDPETRSFRVLKGRSPDERRAWKERMEILRGQLKPSTKAGS